MAVGPAVPVRDSEAVSEMFKVHLDPVPEFKLRFVPVLDIWNRPFSSRSQFTVTFRNLNIGVNSANPDANVGANKDAAELSILSALKDNPKVSQVSISEIASIPRRSLQRIMKKMVDAGKIERIGGTRGYWRINE